MLLGYSTGLQRGAPQVGEEVGGGLAYLFKENVPFKAMLSFAAKTKT